ncbi:MAG: hypothetical protein EP349_03810, partial [Alphaproteobacteria bacterium]
MSEKKKPHPLIILLACAVLTACSFIAGYFTLVQRLDLIKDGLLTDGVVTGVHIGVKGIKNVEASFDTVDGESVTGRDIHATQWKAANETGEKVRLYYDSSLPEVILIERGIWMFANPAFFLCGGFGGLVLMLYLWCSLRPR